MNIKFTAFTVSEKSSNRLIFVLLFLNTGGYKLSAAPPREDFKSRIYGYESSIRISAGAPSERTHTGITMHY